jgi:hypothetical protein
VKGKILFEQKYKKDSATINIKEYIKKYEIVETMVNSVGNIKNTKDEKLEFINVTIYIK